MGGVSTQDEAGRRYSRHMGRFEKYVHSKRGRWWEAKSVRVYHRRGYGVGVEMEGLGSEVGLLGRYKYVPSGEGGVVPQKRIRKGRCIKCAILERMNASVEHGLFTCFYMLLAPSKYRVIRLIDLLLAVLAKLTRQHIRNILSEKILPNW